MATYRKSGNKIRVEICVKGIRKSDTFYTKSEAKVWAAKTETDINNGKSGKAGVNKNVRDLLTAWESVKGCRNTQEECVLRQFQQSSLAPIKLADLTTNDFAQWRDLRLKTVSGSTINRALNFMSAILTVSRVEWGWHNHTCLIRDLKRPKNNDSRSRIATDSEIYAICVQLGFDGEIKLKKHLVACFFVLSVETGLRLGELCKLRSAQVHMDEDYLTVLAKNSKTETERHVPLSPRAKDLLRIRFDAEDINITSNSASTCFNKARGVLGIENLHFHDARHTAVTRMAKKLDVLDLALAIGHSNIKQLQTYYNESATNIAKLLA